MVPNQDLKIDHRFLQYNFKNLFFSKLGADTVLYVFRVILDKRVFGIIVRYIEFLSKHPIRLWRYVYIRDLFLVITIGQYLPDILNIYDI